MEKRSIENIFRQRLENYEIQPDEDEWSAIDLALPRVNFFRFSFVNFNIYYCSLIVLCFLFSTFSLIYTLSGENIRTQTPIAGEKKKTELTIFNKDHQTGLKQINKASKSLVSQKISVVKSKPKESLKTESVSNNKKNTADQKAFVPLTIKGDTLGDKEKLHQLTKQDNSSVTELSQPEQQKKKEVKKKRIVYITKQDTIVVIDTLSKRKPKRKN